MEPTRKTPLGGARWHRPPARQPTLSRLHPRQYAHSRGASSRRRTSPNTGVVPFQSIYMQPPLCSCGIAVPTALALCIALRAGPQQPARARPAAGRGREAVPSAGEAAARAAMLRTAPGLDVWAPKRLANTTPACDHTSHGPPRFRPSVVGCI